MVIDSNRLNRSLVTAPISCANRQPPSPAIAAEIMNTESLSRTTFMPSVAHAAGLFFIAVSRRPYALRRSAIIEHAEHREHDREQQQEVVLRVEVDAEQLRARHLEIAVREDRAPPLAAAATGWSPPARSPPPTTTAAISAPRARYDRNAAVDRAERRARRAGSASPG